MNSRRLYALFGLIATLVGMAVGHFTAALLNPDSSPVLAVGSAIIELTPQPIASWAIDQFGSADKPILIGSVFAGVLVLAAAAGLLARRRFELGAATLVALVAVAAVAVLTRPAVELLDVIPPVITAIAGVAALWWMHRTAMGLPLNPRAKSSAERAKAESTTAAGSATDEDVVVISGAHAAQPSTPGPTRRGILIATSALAAAAVVFGSAGRFITGLRARAEDITLPAPAAGEAAPALPQGLESKVPGITPLQVSNADFYRVDTRLDTPVVSSSDWTLTVDGDVENELEITFDQLLEMPMVERDITLTCVSNSVGGKFVGGARWLGVPLQDILDMAGVGDTADQMLATDFDGMTISTPLDLLLDGREALLCVGMNGEQLPREHGFPVRVIVPGLYGFISATKWVTKLTFTTYADREAYWTERKWGTDAPIKPSARIDTPRPLAQAKPGSDGTVLVGGVAWAQNDKGVAKVQVQVDGGAWKDAMLGPDVNNVYWRQWYFPAELSAGSHNISARVVDGLGDLQDTARSLPFPDGASGIHAIQFTVA